MGTSYNPKIITNNLVALFDAANLKSYPAGQDSYTNNVSLLLDGESLTDKSQNNFTVTNSSVTVSSAQVKYGTSSLYFNGSSYLSIPDSASFSFGTGDFTIEAWVLVTSPITSGSYRSICCKYSAGSIGTEDAFQFLINNSAGTMQVTTTLVSNTFETAYSFNITGATTTLNDTWNHIALTRSSGSLKCFFNGTQIGSTQTYTRSINQGTLPVIVGARTYSPYDLYLTGYIDDLRITKSAIYTANFTPPTGPLRLPGQIIDLTKNKAVGSCNNTPTYSSLGRGSLNFAGAAVNSIGAGIAIPYNSNYDLSSSDFTLEAWCYPTANAYYGVVIGRWSGYGATGNTSWCIRQNDIGKFQFSVSTNGSTEAATITDSVAFSTSTWYCLTAVRSGTSLSFYKNGVLLGTSTVATLFNGSASLTIGNANNQKDTFTGNIANCKIYKGKAFTSTEVLQNFNATKGRFGL